MAVIFCTRHRIGYNSDFDPVCPQCSLSHQEPASTVLSRDELQDPGKAPSRPAEPAIPR